MSFKIFGKKDSDKEETLDSRQETGDQNPESGGENQETTEEEPRIPTISDYKKPEVEEESSVVSSQPSDESAVQELDPHFRKDDTMEEEADKKTEETLDSRPQTEEQVETPQEEVAVESTPDIPTEPEEVEAIEPAEATPEEVPASDPTDSTDLTDPAEPEVATFYGGSIRKFYQKGVWYFSLEDILPLAKISNPRIYLEKKLGTAEFKKVATKALKKMKYEVDEKNIEVDCVSFDGFMALLPMIRSSENTFPGPFPDWLKQTSEFKKET